MTKEQQRQIIELFNDRLEQVIVAIRASHPSAQEIKHLSAMLDDHIKTHEKDTKEINAKLDPMYSAFATVGKIRGAIMWISATVIAIWGGVEAIKKLSGK